MMTLPALYRAARSVESIENYVRSDDPLLQETNSADEGSITDASVVYDDEFWKPKLVESSRNAKGENQSDYSFDFSGFALSEWVARVPGLFGPKALRDCEC